MYSSSQSIYYYDQQKFKRIRRPSRGQLLCFKRKKYPPNKLYLKMKELELNCGVYLDPVIRSTNINEKKSIILLKFIVESVDRTDLQSAEPVLIKTLVLSSLVLVQAYVAHLKTRVNIWDKFKSKPYAKSVKYFHILIFKLIPDLTDMVIDVIMDFLKSERLWNVEFICCEVLTSLLACGTPSAKILSKLLDYLEEQLRGFNVKDARHVIRVLHAIMHEQFWNEQKAVDCKRLIHLYYNSVVEANTADPYFLMRRGFELCLVRMCEIIPNPELMIMIGMMFDLCFGKNIPPENINDFCRALEFAIMFAEVETISEAVEPKVLHYILEAIGSENSHKSRLATRLLARMFDRHRNFAEFITPRIFSPNKYYKINISVYHPEDRDFFKRYRTHIAFHLLLALRLHQSVSNIETMFTVLCTMVVESPYGYTTCQVISILLELQDFALALNENACSTETNQIHAMILSVMTLIAWLHRASSLSLYVRRLLNRRADEAPHLNPPIKIVYHYAQHHVLWNEPNLFFDFWEIRYGLWKRFRSHEPQLPLQSEKILVRKIDKQEQWPTKGSLVQDEIIASNLVRESVETFF